MVEHDPSGDQPQADPARAARQQLLDWHRRGRGPDHWLRAGRLLSEYGDGARAALHLGRIDWPADVRQRVDDALARAGLEVVASLPLW